MAPDKIKRTITINEAHDALLHELARYSGEGLSHWVRRAIDESHPYLRKQLKKYRTLHEERRE